MPSAAAPSELELVRAFVNTLDVERAADELRSPRALVLWLARAGLISPDERAGRAALRRAIAVREALRTLLRANNGAALDLDAVAVLDAAARWSGLAIAFDPDGGVAVEPSKGGVPGAIGAILAVAVRSMTGGTWERLKVCRSTTCEWAFYDRTRNRSRRWCSMAVCGNRAKVGAYRARRRD
jgi:predicted RNA-binding Zn ribbon-like protein